MRNENFNLKELLCRLKTIPKHRPISIETYSLRVYVTIKCYRSFASHTTADTGLSQTSTRNLLHTPIDGASSDPTDWSSLETLRYSLSTLPTYALLTGTERVKNSASSPFIIVTCSLVLCKWFKLTDTFSQSH